VEHELEWQVEQPPDELDETILPPEEKPKADMSFLGELAPHCGQTMSARFTEIRTNSSNLFWHLVHSNS